MTYWSKYFAKSTEAANYSNTALWMLANGKRSSTSGNTYFTLAAKIFFNLPTVQFFDEVIEPTLLRDADTYAQPNSINRSKNKQSFSAIRISPNLQCHAMSLFRMCKPVPSSRRKEARTDHIIQSARCAIIHGISIQYTYIVERNRRRRNWSRIFLSRRS